MSNKKKAELVGAMAPVTAAGTEEVESPAPIRHETVEASPGSEPGAAGAAACDDILRVGRESAAAAAKAGMGIATGWQDFNRAMLNLAQGHVEDMLTAAKALTTARNFHEVIEIQMTLVKSSLEKINAESNRLAEAAMRAANEAGPVGVGLFRFGQGTASSKA